jgi:microcystin-dependent protein
VSRSTYAALFAAIGIAYGAGNGTTTFNLPDLRQRFPLGKAASGTGATLGGTGGAIDHIHNLDNTSAHAQVQMSGGPGNIFMDRQIVPGWTPSVTTVLPNSVTANGTLQTNGTRLAGDTDGENPPFQVVNYEIVAL